MFNYQQIRTVIDPHEQKRQNSCVQSAVEMVLKLNGIIAAGEYPEQAYQKLDGKGFAAYTAIGHRRYGRFLVTFREIKFDKNLCADWRKDAWASGLDHLRGNIFPVYSFSRGAGYHCYLGIPHETDGLQFITKPQVGPGQAEIQGRLGIWQHQFKTEILTVRYRLLR